MCNNKNKLYIGGVKLFKKEKMLILGGSHSEIPLIEAAKTYGYYVITTGNQETGLGHLKSDEFIYGDFSNKELMLDIAQREEISAICSGCNDFALLSTTYVGEQLGIKGHDSYDVSLTLHHKDRYRAFAQANDIPTPRAIQCFSVEDVDSVCQMLRFPVMVKPVDLTGGKGIQCCQTIDEVKIAFEKAIRLTRMSYILIEEFIQGSNHGFSAILQNQKVKFHFVDNEQYYINQYMVGSASTPTAVPESAIRKIIHYSNIMAEKLQLVDGILHIQFILSHEQEPMIIEVCRRTPGDLYVKLVELATGFDYSRALVACEANLAKEEYRPIEPHDYWVRYCIMGEQEGIFKQIKYDASIKPYIAEKMIWAKEGDIIQNKLTYKAGIVFLKCKTKEEQEALLKDLNKKITIELK